MPQDILLLDHGSGGRASARLIRDLFMSAFDNPILAAMNDAAVLDIAGPLAMSTDTYTVDPMFFPGGNIGSLAVHGTVNDVAMLGARPAYLSCGFILEEGLALDDLRAVVAAMAEAAREAGVQIVTGDTKVVPRGGADKIYINTTGIGRIMADPPPTGGGAKPGDAVLISGPVGDHGMAVMVSRSGLAVNPDLKSDSAPLNRMVESLITALGPGEPPRVLRDPTRGGLATTLNEIAGQSGVNILLRENDIPVRECVRSAAGIIGLDPLYLACEGRLICIVAENQAETALAAMRASPHGQNACRIGEVLTDPLPNKRSGQVILQTTLGGKRLLPMLEGEQLPRIC